MIIPREIREKIEQRNQLNEEIADCPGECRC